MRHMSTGDWIAIALLVIGGLNWGLIGAFDFDLVASLFGEGTALSRIIYGLVGLAALFELGSLMARPTDRPAIDRY